MTFLIAVFLRLGVTAFGGPAAHVSLMEDEFVSRRRWLSREEFLDLLGATNLIPGPNSTEMAIHIGYRRAGWRGFLIGGVCFILPAALIVTLLSWVYVRYGSLPQAAGLLSGIKPVIMIVIFQALWRMGRAAMKTRALLAVAIGCALLNAAGVHELAVLMAAGITAVFIVRLPSRTAAALALPLGFPYAAVSLSATAAPFSMAALFLFFMKVGSVLFGGGYVLLAFLRADLVDRWRWLTEAQLLDAIAVGQVTPGPLFTSATFVGYLLAGPWGAAVATIGIFLPAFVFVALSIPLLPRLRTSPTFAAALDGINAGSLALMAVVSWRLGATSLTNWPSLLIACIAAVLLLGYRVNTTWLVLGGAAIGLLFLR
ncbi:MAG: chromate efflux transporter [Candidatus Hydrogenedentes bacterium]|nr:chromate efflux transporter [Candidatus Hydrogenedentota bacterium]